MNILVLDACGAVSTLSFVRMDQDVQVIHEGQVVADVPIRALSDYLARGKPRPWARRRRWRLLHVRVTRDRKVLIRVKGRIATNTLTIDELYGLRRLLSADEGSGIHQAGAARLGGAQPH